MKIRIIKESKLLQEKVEIMTQVSQDDARAYKVIFWIRTGEVIVKQLLTIRRSSPGTAFVVFDDQLPKVQKCFPKPPEKTYKGDTLDPIHQLQVDYGYVMPQIQWVKRSTLMIITLGYLVIQLTMALIYLILIFMY